MGWPEAREGRGANYFKGSNGVGLVIGTEKGLTEKSSAGSNESRGGSMEGTVDAGGARRTGGRKQTVRGPLRRADGQGDAITAD